MSAPTVRVILALWLPGMMAGCGTVPRQNFYTLSPVATAERAATINSRSDLAVSVDAATVPEGVDRPQFVVSTGDSRVSILEQQRWAEPLKSQISRIVAMNLARLLGTPRVSADPQADGGAAAYRVQLEFQRFESRPGDAVAIEVLWTVRRGAAGETKSGRAAVRENVAAEGYEALVAAHNRALASVSRDIAAAIQ